MLQAIEDGTFDYAVTFPNSKRAAKFAPKTVAAGTPLRQLLDRWYRKQHQYVKASTLEGYRKIVNNILIPQLGDLGVAELKRATVREWCEGYDASNKRIANVLSILRMVLDEAVDAEVIPTNPIKDFTFRRKEVIDPDADPADEDDIEPFTQAEQQAILQHAGAWQPLFQFAFWTGLRTSELCGLRWRNVADEYVEITHVKTAASDVLEVPKTKASRRKVRLLAPAREAIAAVRHKGEFVFLNPSTGYPFQGDQEIRNGWVRALEAAGVKYRRQYQTRHTFASMMLSAGENPVWVAQQMGHTDFSMLVRVYGRWIPEQASDAGSKAVDKFWSAK